MELRQYLALLWKWAWLILLCVLLAGASAFLVSDRQPPTYQATTTLLISQATSATYDSGALLTGERLARTYAQLLTKRPVMEEVATRLNLSVSATALANRVSVNLVRDTQLITLRVVDEDPARAKDIANTIPEVFGKHNETMQLVRYSSSRENLQKQLGLVNGDISATETSLEALRAVSAPDQAEINRLEAALLQYRTTYANLLRSYEDIRIAEAQTLDTITVVEPAVLATSPVGPKTKTNTLLAGVVGAMVAVGVAFLIEYLDDTVKNPDDVQRATNLPTLGAVVQFDEPRLGDEEPIMAARPKSVIAEGYRVARTNLQFSTMGLRKSGAVLLVTSAQPLEGKTTSLSNLGVSLAQAGKRVLLVDTDLRRPALHRHFNLSKETGLTSLLLESQADVGRVIQKTKVEGLSVLPSGRVPANPADVLGFPEMAQLLDQLRSMADYVLLDSPPVLSVADASILAQQVDGVVMVVESGRTRTDMVRRAVSMLEGVKARVLGVLLNKISVRRSSYYDYHYYYYYSGYYTDTDGGGTRRGKRSAPRNPLRRFGHAIGRFFRRSAQPAAAGDARRAPAVGGKRA